MKDRGEVQRSRNARPRQPSVQSAILLRGRLRPIAVLPPGRGRFSDQAPEGSIERGIGIIADTFGYFADIQGAFPQELPRHMQIGRAHV